MKFAPHLSDLLIMFILCSTCFAVLDLRGKMRVYLDWRSTKVGIAL